MLDRAALAAAVARHGIVTRVVIAAQQGSTPREAGVAMLVWAEGAGFGQAGTIGGGALEWQAAAHARKMLDLAADARPPGLPAPASRGSVAGLCQTERLPLGPALGQCCGGAVTLVYELIDADALAAIPDAGLHVRRISGGSEMPLAIARVLKDVRGQGRPAITWKSGWLAEPVLRPLRPLWIWGAGHVGRAIVSVLSPLPEFALTWVDTDSSRFPETIPPGVTVFPDADPAALVAKAPPEAEHLILTFSHALDLELCHRLLAHGFRDCGLIGSASKSARFRSRLTALGHGPASVARIRCPIGDPALGKHPQAIAVAVAAELLQPARAGGRAAGGMEKVADLTRA